MSDERLRVGIVGCGYQGGRLAEAIGLGDAFVVASCADPDEAAAAKLAATVGQATTYASVEEMLQSADLDVAMVATPHHLLAATSLKAIWAGKHVLVEKPIAMSQREASAVENAVAEAGVCYLAGYSFRNLPAWTAVHDLLAAGAVGDIVSVTGYFGLGPLSTGWMADPACGGGPLLYLGSHLVDQILWYVADEPVEVFADVRYRSDTGADETSTFQIRFARGATAQCCVTQAADRFRHTLEIVGRSGYLSLRPCGFLDYEITVESSALADYAQPTVLRPPLAGDPRNVKHLAQLSEFAAAILQHQEPAVTVSDGRRVLAVLDAVIASGRSGRPVAL